MNHRSASPRAACQALFCRPNPSAPIALAVAMLLAGCEGQSEQIRSYSVPKQEVLLAEHGQDPPPPRLAASAPTAPALTGPARTLGAIVPFAPQAWFFKLTGPDAEVAALAEPFENMIRSVEFDPATGQPSWTIPLGWDQHGAEGMRFATLHVSHESATPLELTVIPLAYATSDAVMILDNINRWRSQLGLPPIAAEEVSAESQQIDLENATATLVNLAGEAGDGGMQPPFASLANGSAAPASAPEAPSAGSTTSSGELSYDLPAGWQTASGSSISLAAFSVSSGGQQANITVTSLASDGGGALSNINRWRGQVGLPATSDAALGSESEAIEVSGQTGTYVRLIGPSPATPTGAILGAIVPAAGRTYFIKLVGPGDLASREEANFIQFVQSLRFN